MKRRNTVYVRVLLVVLSLVVLLVFMTRGTRHPHRDAWLPSSFNPVGAGSMAFYTTLQDLNWPVERWREPFSRLSQEGTNNVLVITRSASGSPPVLFSEQENLLLADWVREGNTVVLLGALARWDDTRGLLDAFGFGLPDKSLEMTGLWHGWTDDARQRITLHRGPGATAATPDSLEQPRTEPLFIHVAPNVQTLWQSEGQPYMVRMAYGRGAVIYGSSDRLLSRTCLDTGDNLKAILPLFMPDGTMPRRLLFEETHHGFSGAFAMVRLLEEPGLRFAALLALLGTLTFLGSSLVRFGPIIPLKRAAGRSSLEFVDSIADLYMRANLRDETMWHLFAETHQCALKRLNLPPTATHALIASRLEQAQPHLPKWKKLAQRFDSNEYVQGLPPGGWVRVARELIQIKTALA